MENKICIVTGWKLSIIAALLSVKENSMKKIQFILIVFLILALSAVLVTPVLADDGQPPVETPEVVTEAEEESTLAQVTDESQQEEPVAEEVSTVSELLDSAPPETEVIILDENGETLPLASQEASEVVASSDPIWCPAGVAVPVSGGAGCSPSFTGMTGLIGWLNVNNPNMAGTIWIEKTYDSSTAVGDGAATSFTLDGTTLSNMANFALMLKGGWNGLGTGTVDTSDDSNFREDSFNIINWKGNITINDIAIYNATTNPNENAALHVETEGSITLNRVDVRFNDGALAGASLYNDFPGKSGLVTINNSLFSNNAYGGARIESTGAVTIKDSAFDYNSSSTSGAGLSIDNRGDTTPSPVTITGSSAILNGDNGFEVYSNGVVTLKDVIASLNLGSGAVIDTASNAAGTANVVLGNTNTFENNGQYGLSVLTNSSITIKHIVANGNELDNALLDNNLADTNVLIKPITINGSGIFNGSTGGSGLLIISNGAVTLNNITAGNNRLSGATIYTDTGILNNSSVTLKGTNTFNNNTAAGGIYGLYITADGNISVSNVTANSNGGGGVRLDNDFPPSGKSPSVTVLGFLTALNNNTRGLNIVSDGVISITNITASGNGLYGAYIENDGAPTPKAVKIIGTNIFNNNEDASGLEIHSLGAVTLNNVTANNNGHATNDSAGDGVNITNTGGDAGNMAVTLVGYGVFNENDGSGLEIFSDGAVTTNNLTASDNGAFGVLVLNLTAASSAVSMKGVNFFNGNGTTGLDVRSDGAVTLSKATANANGIGIWIRNTAALSAPVTLSGFVTTNNNTIGTLVSSNGVITVANSTAIGNGRGMELNNSAAATPKAVVLTGNNYFENNLLIGLNISSDGAIITNNVTALENGLSGSDGFQGVSLTNNYDPAAQQPVTMNGYNIFNGNGLHGLEIYSYGVVTLNNVTALDNGQFVNDVDGSGVVVNNQTGATAARGVVLRGTNVFNGSDAVGLSILTAGSITLSNITAYGNDSQGVYLNNDSPLIDANILVSGYGVFDGNGSIGLYIQGSSGTFSGTNITAINNGGTGLYADIIGLTKPQDFILKGNNTFNANTNTGLYVRTDGNITVNNVNANNNSAIGAYLDNYTHWFAGTFPTFGSITQTGFGSFNNNAGNTGLHVLTNGNISLMRITANYNGNSTGEDGIHVDANGDVTLVCAVAIGNFEDGLQAIVDGNLTIKGLVSSLNGDDQDLAVNGTTKITACP